jgi:uncharacterized protein Yka (UPF0111/DUF47 family)
MEVVDVSVRHWFLPESPELLEMLAAQATITVEGMDALVAWATGNGGAASTVRDCEHRADDAKRTMWRALREAFSPPLDAEDIYTLSADLDELLNGAKDLVREMEVMGMEPDAPMREMAEQLAAAVRSLTAAFAALGGRGVATEHADAAIKCERNVEHVYRAAMSALLETPDVRDVMGRREAYRRMSRLGDQVHAVAERIWYAVVKEA